MHFDEAFWVAVSFFIFIALVVRPVGRALAKQLDGRAAKIKLELDEAVRLKEEAQAVLALYQRKHKKTIEEAEEIISHAQHEAERVAAIAKDNLEKDITRRTEIAIEKIAQAEANVLREIKENAVDITINAAKAIIEENIGQETAEEIISRALSDIDRKFH